MAEVVDCARPPRLTPLLADIARRTAEEARKGKNVVILGSSKSGKTSILLNVLHLLRKWGVRAEYTTVYYECNLRDIRLVKCRDENARVLLIDDLDLAFAMPKLAVPLVKRIGGYEAIIAVMTKPVLVGHDLELIEPLLGVLGGAVKIEIPGKSADKGRDVFRTRTPLILSRFFGNFHEGFDIYVI